MEQNKNAYLSVIVPVFNGERYIKSLIKSFDRQSFRDFEVIIVDDGSTDQTYKKCMHYAAQRSWLKVIHTENHGVSHARNTGIEAAEGEWIQFIDSDDIVVPEMFERFAEVSYSQEVDLIVCGCQRINLKSRVSEYCGPECEQVLRKQELESFLNKIPMTDRYWALDYIWNKWLKREIVEKYRLRFCESLSLGEDFVFNTKYYQHISSAIFLNQPYYQYRVGDTGLVSRFQPEPWVGGMKLYEAHKELCEKWNLWNTNEEWVRCQAGQMAFGNMRLLNSPNCKYKARQKREFLQHVVDSQVFPMILEYLKSQSAIRFKVYRSILKRKNIRMIYGLIQLEKYIGKLKK